MTRMLLAGLMLMLSGCGYHLIGQGGGSGAIPADVQTISLIGNADTQLLSQFRQRLQSDRYAIIDAADTTGEHTTHAMLHINLAPLTFTPSAFDATGIATQYRMIFSGALLLEQQGKTLWQSGSIQRQGDVFVTGGPTSIEASRQRLLSDLQQQWLSDTVGRIRSGF